MITAILILVAYVVNHFSRSPMLELAKIVCSSKITAAVYKNVSNPRPTEFFTYIIHPSLSASTWTSKSEVLHREPEKQTRNIACDRGAPKGLILGNSESGRSG